MKRRMMSLLLAMAMLCTLVPTAFAASSRRNITIDTDLDTDEEDYCYFYDKDYDIDVYNEIIHELDAYYDDSVDADDYYIIFSDEDDETRIFHAVAAKDNITVIRIYSTRMLMAYGFLRRVFEVFEKYRTPIDMITTAEVSVSLTVDNTSHLDEIEKELASFGKIEVEQDNTIVCLVGNLEHSQKGLAATIMNSIHGIPLKMISYGASHRSIAMLVDTKYKKEMMQSMNDKLFGKENHA